ncbi:MAG: hypothetical protein QXD02_04530 [Candidatus Parvarchaeum sp.]|jgi:hypothetical protein|nr:hypothetical protein [Candidatus Parvarchaeum tengchongense]MCW1295285.1 hypothetical protein [Candidatus Parvarchaeum tengchongense]MCW1299556.1 hypothetical protein [Candidatus Parvarchaeum tengchongense]
MVKNSKSSNRLKYVYLVIFIVLITSIFVSYYEGYSLGYSSNKSLATSLSNQISSLNNNISNLNASLNSKIKNISKEYGNELNSYNKLLNNYILLNETTNFNANLTIFGNYSFDLPAFNNNTQTPGMYYFDPFNLPFNGYAIINVYNASNCALAPIIFGSLGYGDGQLFEFNGNDYCISYSTGSNVYLFTPISSGNNSISFYNYDGTPEKLTMNLIYIATFKK